MLTGAVQALTKDGWEAELSPDGKQLLYVEGALREIRIAGPLGESPRTFFRAPDGELVASAHWLPGENRIGYLTGKDGEPNARIETRDLEGKNPRRILEANTESVVFASDGRVFYTTKDPRPQPSASLWTIATDPKSGAPIGSPSKLATWAGAIAAQPLTTSTDGRRLGVTKLFAQSDVYLLQLDGAGRSVAAMRQLTTDTQADWPSQWTREGSFLFYSNREGAMHAFTQTVSTEAPQTIVAGSADVRAPQITSDGKWITYIDVTNAPNGARVMRVPTAGGPAQLVMNSTSGVGTATLQYFWVGPGALGSGAHAWPDIRCPSRAPAATCFIAEDRPGTGQRRKLVVSTFDSATGGSREVATLVDELTGGAFWDVSPDGATVAFGTFSWQAGDAITLLNVASGDRRVIRPKNIKNLNDVAWAADGTSLFATAMNIRRAEVYRIALDGTPTLLRSFESQTVLNPRPSPDGRSLLIGLLRTSANAWMIER